MIVANCESHDLTAALGIDGMRDYFKIMNYDFIL